MYYRINNYQAEFLSWFFIIIYGLVFVYTNRDILYLFSVVRLRFTDIDIVIALLHSLLTLTVLPGIRSTSCRRQDHISKYFFWSNCSRPIHWTMVILPFKHFCEHKFRPTPETHRTTHNVKHTDDGFQSIILLHAFRIEMPIVHKSGLFMYVPFTHPHTLKYTYTQTL